MSDDEKDRAYWLNVEDRELLVQHMEAILVRLGRADLRCEDLRRRAHVEQDPRKKKDLIDAAALATQQLEALAGQAIELGRALARRPDAPVPQFPEQIPQAVKDNPVSDYGGKAAVPTEVDINVGTNVPRGSA